MFSLWVKIRNLFRSLLRPSQRRASKRPARRRLFAEPLEARAVPSAAGLGGGGPFGGRGKSILAPGQGSLTLANDVSPQGNSGPGPGYPLPPGLPPLGG